MTGQFERRLGGETLGSKALRYLGCRTWASPWVRALRDHRHGGLVLQEERTESSTCRIHFDVYIFASNY